MATWVRGAARLIEAKVADAEAHAVKALTEALRQEPDGRSTTNRVRRSRSIEAARHRLSELLDGLAGPAIDSLDGLIRDGREQFLVTAFREWSALLDDATMRPSRTPTEAERKAIRRYEAHGLPLRHEVQGRIDAVSRSLVATVAQASGRAIGDRSAMTLIRTWRRQASRSILSTVQLALSDSAVIADTAAQWLLVRPELRGDDDDPPIEV